MKKYILKISCLDKPYIINKLSGAISECSGNIIDLDQYSDLETKNFYLRMTFAIKPDNYLKIKGLFQSIKTAFSMDLLLREEGQKKKLIILCSKQPHCLLHLLEKQRQGDLSIEICCIVSNHQDCKRITEYHDLPFYYFPITSETKAEQESKLEQLINDHNADYIVLARYMQILSEEFCEKYHSRIINIHHSFLPGFKGTNPYKQAHTKGVKVIGATSHFVTKDLDEGPIIYQKTLDVSHNHSVEDLIRYGADIESIVLARAIKYVSEDKVFINLKKTVVFK